MDGWRRDGNNALVFLSLRFIQHQFQCFSDWTKQEIGLYWDFNNRIHNLTWDALLKQGGKVNKAGFAPTIISRKQYPQGAFIENLDSMTELFELRINEKIRVHGFRDRPFYYICYLDRNHEICS